VALIASDKWLSMRDMRLRERAAEALAVFIAERLNG
jgi:hypothetical protein